MTLMSWKVGKEKLNINQSAVNSTLASTVAPLVLETWDALTKLCLLGPLRDDLKVCVLFNLLWYIFKYYHRDRTASCLWRTKKCFSNPVHCRWDPMEWTATARTTHLRWMTRFNCCAIECCRERATLLSTTYSTECVTKGQSWTSLRFLEGVYLFSIPRFRSLLQRLRLRSAATSRAKSNRYWRRWEIVIRPDSQPAQTFIYRNWGWIFSAAGWTEPKLGKKSPVFVDKGKLYL